MEKGVLVLENGTVFSGRLHAKQPSVVGEVVFNTGMTGYQEILSDPSYCGQIITMTYPLIGNYGVNPDDFESRKSFAKGFIAREICEHPSNFRCGSTLYEYLAEQGLTVLTGIDTRKLVRMLRESGTMKGVIAPEGMERGQIKEMIDGFQLKNPVDEVTAGKIERHRSDKRTMKVALMDYGVKRNIIRSLLLRGMDVDVFPASTAAVDILGNGYDGVMLSNGPGDPKDCKRQIDTISELAGKIPIFAICLGHQLTALAMGGDTHKLKYGHRGSNHPVKDIFHDRTYITSQNHGYAVTAKSLEGKKAVITHMNMNDMTVEGIRYEDMPLFSVQFHPEASPGPGDTGYLFDGFVKMMLDFKGQGGENAQKE